MKKQECVLIFACDKDGAIGQAGQLPWHLSDDLKHFKEKTKFHSVIMGRKTYDSIGKPLPDRYNIVLSQKSSYYNQQLVPQDNLVFVSSAESALEMALKQSPYRDKAIFIMGGGQIYKLFYPYATHVERTMVHTVIQKSDTFFALPSACWKIVQEKSYFADSSNDYNFTIQTLEYSKEH